MPKVTAFTIDGLILNFYTNGEHDPPHFHAKKLGKWEIRINYTLCTETELHYKLKWPKTLGRNMGPTSAEIQLILANVLQHRHALQLQWDAKVKPNFIGPGA